MTNIRHRHAVRPLARRITAGFTLIEMVVVMSLIALLLTLAVPRYFHALDNGRVAVQRQNLATMRDAIDKFYGDQGRYPDALDELVSKRYLREVPVDPMTDKPDWTVLPPTDASAGAVFDIRSSLEPAAGAASASGG
jgi:general secretion pathway protein G